MTPAPRMMASFSIRTGPCPLNGVSFQPAKDFPSKSDCHSPTGGCVAAASGTWPYPAALPATRQRAAKRSGRIGNGLRSVEDAAQVIDFTRPDHRVFINLGWAGQAHGHSLTVAARQVHANTWPRF